MFNLAVTLFLSWSIPCPKFSTTVSSCSNISHFLSVYSYLRKYKRDPAITYPTKSRLLTVFFLFLFWRPLTLNNFGKRHHVSDWMHSALKSVHALINSSLDEVTHHHAIFPCKSSIILEPTMHQSEHSSKPLIRLTLGSAVLFRIIHQHLLTNQKSKSAINGGSKCKPFRCYPLCLFIRRQIVQLDGGLWEKKKL